MGSENSIRTGIGYNWTSGKVIAACNRFVQPEGSGTSAPDFVNRSLKSENGAFLTDVAVGVYAGSPDYFVGKTVLQAASRYL